MTFALLALALLTADPPAAGSGPPAGRFDGTWFFEDFRRGKGDPDFGSVWNSPVTVAGEAFTVQKFFDGEGGYAGKLVFDADQPTHVDLVLTEFDLTPLGVPMKIPGGPRLGVFAFDGDALRLAFNREPGGERPATVDGPADTVLRMTLKRAPAGVAAPPKEFRVAVTGPGGKPVAGARIVSFADFGNIGPGDDRSTPGVPNISPKAATTGTDGTATIAYKDYSLGRLIAYDPAAGRIAYAPLTPAGLMGGTAAVKLVDCRVVTLPLACPELTGPLRFVNGYLYANGRMATGSASRSGKPLTYLLPPGEYKLWVYGEDVNSQKPTITVPPGDGPLVLSTLTLKPNALALLVGKPAPEFAGVVGRKGGSIKLADYRGQYVVVDFWGYWCGPCVESMPAWVAVHDKLAGKGVAVIGVHQDTAGEVATVEQYDAKMKSIVANEWKGRDLPFPVAFVSGKAGAAGPAQQYAVEGWPTTILIGPDGTVVGRIHARTGEEAVKLLEGYLAKLPPKK